MTKVLSSTVNDDTFEDPSIAMDTFGCGTHNFSPSTWKTPYPAASNGWSKLKLSSFATDADVSLTQVWRSILWFMMTYVGLSLSLRSLSFRMPLTLWHMDAYGHIWTHKTCRLPSLEKHDSGNIKLAQELDFTAGRAGLTSGFNLDKSS